MLKVERYKLILDLINKKQNITVEELTKHLDVSEATIRRDLNSLEEIGKIKRVHGGAISIESEDDWIGYRQEINLDAKEKIAKYATSFIKEGDTIFLDAGSTVLGMIQYLEKIKKIKVITNSLTNIEELSKYKIESYLIGGKLKVITHSLVGSTAILSLKNFNFNLAFIGTNSITIEGYSTPDYEEAVIKSEVLLKSERSFILCDSTKFDNKYFINFSTLEGTNLITDNKKLNDEIKNKLENLYITD